MAFVDIYGAEDTSTDAYAEIDCVDELSLDTLQALMPSGPAWPRDADAEQTSLARALSYEFSRVKMRARDLIEEMDPRTTTEMLPDWERVYGLPDECAQPTTLAGRRIALQGRMTGRGSPSIPNIGSISEGIGYPITITENYRTADMFSCTSPCNSPLRTRKWMYLWTSTARYGTANTEYECVLDSITPSYTVLETEYNLPFTARSAAEANAWQSICWSPELSLFCAISTDGTHRVMTSPDGITWTARTAAEANPWFSVCWSPSLSLFCAVTYTGTHRVMTSPDGITWTARTAAEANPWGGVCWSPGLGLFCAVASSGTHRVMTSPDGITWTSRTHSASASWYTICWSPELSLFCSVATTNFGSALSLVMTSPDGVTWTTQTAAEANSLVTVCWSPELELFCAASYDGTHPVQTSPDGITWTVQTATSSFWRCVIWVSELRLFVSVASAGTYRVMTSTDGVTWTARAAAEADSWNSIAYAPGLDRFCAVAGDGTHRVMTA